MSSEIKRSYANSDDNSKDGNEALDQQPTHGTYIEKDQVVNLSQEHREYLVKRHGTADLDPIPAFGDADPYNWPQWKVSQNLCKVISQTMLVDNRSRKFQTWYWWHFMP